MHFTNWSEFSGVYLAKCQYMWTILNMAYENLLPEKGYASKSRDSEYFGLKLLKCTEPSGINRILYIYISYIVQFNHTQ